VRSPVGAGFCKHFFQRRRHVSSSDGGVNAWCFNLACSMTVHSEWGTRMHEASNEDTARAVYCRTTLPFLAERVGHDVEARHNLARPVKTRKKYLVQDRVLR
jgi:hypothetical protein